MVTNAEIIADFERASKECGLSENMKRLIAMAKKGEAAKGLEKTLKEIREKSATKYYFNEVLKDLESLGKYMVFSEKIAEQALDIYDKATQEQPKEPSNV